MVKGNIVEYDGKNYISVSYNSAEEAYNCGCSVVIAVDKLNGESIKLFELRLMKCDGMTFDEAVEDCELRNNKNAVAVACFIPIN